MSHTNSTANYNLPQFVGTDTPAWLTDVNGAFEDIDSAIANTAMAAQEAKQAADAAQGTATSAANVASVLANTTVPALSARVTDLHNLHLLAESAESAAAGVVITCNDDLSNYHTLILAPISAGAEGGQSFESFINYDPGEYVTFSGLSRASSAIGINTLRGARTNRTISFNEFRQYIHSSSGGAYSDNGQLPGTNNGFRIYGIK